MADSLSRTVPLPTEWKVSSKDFERLLQWHGHLQVDLMATPLNNQLPSFVTPFYHPGAIATNALTIDWNQWSQIYMFPPPNLLTEVIHVLSNYQHHGIIIAPWRPAAPWFPLLLNRTKKTLPLLEPLQQCVQGRLVFADFKNYDRWTAFSF